MKHVAITTDGHVLALESISEYDLVSYPVPVECTKKQFQKEKDLWIKLFDMTWSKENNSIVGKMVS